MSAVDVAATSAAHAAALETREKVASLFELPFLDLVMMAYSVHRSHHRPNAVQLSALLSIKIGGCAEAAAVVASPSKPGAGSNPKSSWTPMRLSRPRATPRPLDQAGSA